MKKLLVLALVLGLTSMASALFMQEGSYTLDNVTWTVVNDQLIGIGNSLGVYDGAMASSVAGVLTPDATSDGADPGLYIAAGDNGQLMDIGGFLPNGFTTYAQDLGHGYQVAGQVWFAFDLGGQTDITFYNDISHTPVLQGTIHIIPEPMTIALLGLGGLFLRRRK